MVPKSYFLGWLGAGSPVLAFNDLSVSWGDSRVEWMLSFTLRKILLKETFLDMCEKKKMYLMKILRQIFFLTGGNPIEYAFPQVF